MLPVRLKYKNVGQITLPGLQEQRGAGYYFSRVIKVGKDHILLMSNTTNKRYWTVERNLTRGGTAY